MIETKMGGDKDDADATKAKRGYRACLHCRSRKAKCDLGDIDAPSEPPCSRCRRESRECVFAPSRRGGNNKRRREGTAGREQMREHEYESGGAGGEGRDWERGDEREREQRDRERERERDARDRGDLSTRPYSPHGLPPHYAQRFPRSTSNASPKSEYPLFNHASSSSDMSPSTGHGPSPASGPHTLPPLHGPVPHGHGHHRGTGGHEHEKRRRLHLNPLHPPHKSDPSSIVVADVQNESDALHILALASAARPSSSDLEGTATRAPENGRATPTRRTATMDDFALVRLGIVDEEQIVTLVHSFFQYNHHMVPMVPVNRIPQTPAQIAEFARDERYFVTAMIIISSRCSYQPGMREVHNRAWQVFRGWLSDITCLGAPPTVGLVEALLLLAENLPRDPQDVGRGRGGTPDPTHAQGFGEEVHGAENNQAWMLIGMAIRLAYSLGIDKLALKLVSEVDRTYEVERARLAWTYCYLFDRHVSLRLGRAFWSRGPALCFQGFSASAQTGPPAAAGNFPHLREVRAPEGGAPPGFLEQEDLASLVQASLELTQLMSNAHEVLYPNAARTRSLVVYGEYFKYIDELARSLDGFKVLWREKKWKFPLTDTVWAMFYYTQLYICAFSFQAHVERAALAAEEEYRENSWTPRPSISLFPRGAAASPDARYIFQSIDAARQLVNICVDRLHPGGAMPYLPNRFLLWFTYAAIVLLKALYSGAMLRADHADVHKLIDRLCEAFAETSRDADHPAVRYGQQLQALRVKLGGIATSANSPTGGGTVPLPPTDDASVPEHKPEAANERGERNGERNGGDPEVWFPPGPQAGAAGAPLAPFPYATPGYSYGFVAPPHEQPLSEISSLQIGVDQNLGFATLDDWFPGGVAPPQGPGIAAQQAGSVPGVTPIIPGAGPAGNPFEALDLADFWMKVGPGEAQGGFPFR